MNKIILMGRLVRDPETRYVNAANGQLAITSYRIAVDRQYKRDGEPTADYFTCKSFGKSGEFAGQYFRKGTKVVVSGRVETGSYKNKNGDNIPTADVIIESQEFAESNKAAGGQQAPKKQKKAEPAPATGFDVDGDGFMKLPDGSEDELPFN